MATVTAIEQSCEWKRCRMGSCDWRRLKCVDADTAIKAGHEIRRIPHAKLSFKTEAGAQVTARPRLSKLELTHAEAGAVIPILYRRSSPGYVTTRSTLKLSLMGLAVSAAGLVVLWLGRLLQRRQEQAAPAAVPATRHTSGEPAKGWWLRHRQQAASSATRAHVGQPSHQTGRQPAGQPASPTVRQGPVQRNTGWFS